jgi:outer membrane protein
MLLLLISGRISAQETLTLQKAMEVALANNFEVRIAQEQAAMAGNNATIGNAGMLPDLGVEVGQQNSINNTRQEFLTGRCERARQCEVLQFQCGRAVELDAV